MSDDGFISLNQLIETAGRGKVYSAPLFLGNLFFHIPLLKNVLLKLYGNFLLDNSKIKKQMNVTLETTKKSLPKIFK
jgi:hypothetical protein